MQITGTPGDDDLTGSGGDDLIRGLGGSDVLVAREGLDTLEGGAGADLLLIDFGEGAVMDGGAGDDTLGGFVVMDQGTNVTMNGGAGADSFRVSDGTRVTDFTAQDEIVLLSGFSGVYVIGDQVRRAQVDGETVFEVDPLAFRFVPFGRPDGPLTFTVAGDAADLIVVPGLGRTDGFFMSVSPTALVAPDAAGFADLENGRALADARGEALRVDDFVAARLTGQGGDDTLEGGLEGDWLAGGGGADTVSGRDGDDVLGGGAGEDTVDGGAGDDLLYGSAGDDLLFGGEGGDMLMGGGGDDVIYGDGAP